MPVKRTPQPKEPYTLADAEAKKKLRPGTLLRWAAEGRVEVWAEVPPGWRVCAVLREVLEQVGYGLEGVPVRFTALAHYQQGIALVAETPEYLRVSARDCERLLHRAAVEQVVYGGANAGSPAFTPAFPALPKAPEGFGLYQSVCAPVFVTCGASDSAVANSRLDQDKLIAAIKGLPVVREQLWIAASALEGLPILAEEGVKKISTGERYRDFAEKAFQLLNQAAIARGHDELHQDAMPGEKAQFLALMRTLAQTREERSLVGTGLDSLDDYLKDTPPALFSWGRGGKGKNIYEEVLSPSVFQEFQKKLSDIEKSKKPKSRKPLSDRPHE
jgi:hypothetical protein